jgi:methanethiol S-methyltransferase
MERATGIGFWQLTILMVVIASWLLYRYVAPRGWREWSRAGLVEAFIIALYAEMYGFPLTIYVLSGFVGLRIPWLHESGHLWATLFGWGDLGAMVEMLIGYAVVFFGLSLLIEGWREVYRASREGRLATDRLYGVVRHPQYTGIFLGLFGQLIHWPTIPTVVLFPVVVWAYVRLARREERQMMERFGDAYEAYRRRVPMFFPPRGQWRRLLEASRSSAETQ